MSKGSSKQRQLMVATNSGRYHLTKDGRWCQGKWIGSRCYQNQSSSFRPARSSRSCRISRAFWMSKGEANISREKALMLVIKITTGFFKSSSNSRSTITDNLLSLCSSTNKAHNPHITPTSQLIPTELVCKVATHLKRRPQSYNRWEATWHRSHH